MKRSSPRLGDIAAVAASWELIAVCEFSSDNGPNRKMGSGALTESKENFY